MVNKARLTLCMMGCQFDHLFLLGLSGIFAMATGKLFHVCQVGSQHVEPLNYEMTASNDDNILHKYDNSAP